MFLIFTSEMENVTKLKYPLKGIMNRYPMIETSKIKTYRTAETIKFESRITWKL